MSDIFDHEGDALERLLAGEEDAPRGPKVTTCRRCGRTGLRWKQLTEGWRLHSYEKDAGNGIPGLVKHVCKEQPK